jgi:hypothetical protein
MEIEILLKSLYGHLPEIFFHTPLQKARGRLGVKHEKTGLIEQKILSRSSPVKGKFAGRIFLEYSSYDEYSELLKNLGPPP